MDREDCRAHSKGVPQGGASIPQRAKKAHSQNQELRKGGLTGSSEERQTIIEALDAAKNPSAHIKQAVADALARAAAPATLNDPNSVRSWTSNLRKALETISVLEPEDDDDAVEQEGDRLFAFFDKMTLSQPAPELQPSQPPTDKGPDVVTDDGDDEDDNVVGGPDVCESDEMDIFGIPIQDIRRSFLEYLVHPVLLARAYAKLKASDDDVAAGAMPGYHCPQCALYTHRDPVPENVSETISKLERHLVTHHSDWDDLELKIVTSGPNGVKYHCPAGDYVQGDSVQDVRRHALSSTCVNSELYNAMARLREEVVPKDNISRSFRDKRQGRSNVANGVNRWEVEEEPEETLTLDLNDQVKGLVKAAVEFYDDPDVETVAQVLLDYVEDEAASLRPLLKGEKAPLSSDWEALGLDKL
ncbi:hypothetical protein GGX14DRAFT_391162 [Mycena pura]|uniref:Uncharacterized protein n=1 Tax=Mycena pura TaxID=153505 RepID=A0AAD6VQ51_9AGAR|nr:hypothetical protein GGX14DRAFT_391162 [Mycena pura]